MSSRILILIILLIGIDAYSYQWFKQLFPTQVLSLKIIANIVFWLGTLISIFLFVTYFTGASDKLPNQLLVCLQPQSIPIFKHTGCCCRRYTFFYLVLWHGAQCLPVYYTQDKNPGKKSTSFSGRVANSTDIRYP